MPSEGVYLGEGIPPVPDKLAAKIRKSVHCVHQDRGAATRIPVLD